MSRKLRYLLRRTINGQAYVYFRARGGQLTRLPGAEGSAEFMGAYNAALAAMLGTADAERAQPDAKKLAGMPDSLGAAIGLYLDSTKFRDLKPKTKKFVLRACNELREHRLAGARLRDVDTDAVDIYSEEIARERSNSIADRHVATLSVIWQNARKYPQFQIKKLGNPTAEAEKRYSVAREHRPWPVDLQEKFMATAPDYLQLAKLMLHFTLQRGGDCVRMRWADYDGAGLLVRQEKTGGEADAVAQYHPCPAPLRAALDATPRTAETILTTMRGTPWSNSEALSAAIRKHLIKIGAAKKGTRTFNMHGLRKTGAVDVLRLGATVGQLKAKGGWKSDSQALYYARLVNAQQENERTVALWDAALERKEAERAVAERRAAIRAVK